MRVTLDEEKRLWKKGFKRVACLDEVGRGCVAGPVVAVVTIYRKSDLLRKLWRKLWTSDLRHIRDSKKLTCQRRKEFYKILIKNPAIEWGIGRVSEKVIDKINILEATKLAMKRAILKLKKRPVFLILDGKMKLDISISQKSLVKADEKVFSCAAASIIAKVTRDRIMMRCHRKYPQYRFDLHKGYLTKLHLKMLKKYGSCEIHRKSFRPVKSYPPTISKRLRRACPVVKF